MPIPDWTTTLGSYKTIKGTMLINGSAIPNPEAWTDPKIRIIHTLSGEENEYEASIENATGVISYELTPDDYQYSGTYEIKFSAKDPNGKLRFFPENADKILKVDD